MKITAAMIKEKNMPYELTEVELKEPQADDIPKDDYRSTKGRPVVSE